MNYNLYPKQGRFVGSQAHVLAFVAGIGSGKSLCGCLRGLMASYGYIGQRQIVPTPNLGIITAPTYQMLRDATLRTFKEAAGDLLADFNKTEMRATLTNGSEVLFRSTDNPEVLRGPSVTWAMMDEAALSSKLSFNILFGRLRQFGRFGHLWLTTTPKGRDWIYEMFVQHPAAGWKLFRMTTSENLSLAREIVEAWGEAYSGDFYQQELLGEFVAFAGLIYPEFSRDYHMRSQQPSEYKAFYAGVDWGFTNPGVILVAGEDYDGRLWLVHEEYQRQRHIDDWTLIAKDLHETYQLSALWCDPSKPDYIAQFRDAGLPAQKADNTVSTGLQAVRRRLTRRADGEPRLLMLPSIAATSKEMEQYSWRKGKGDDAYLEEPVKANDHGADALRYLVMGVDDADNAVNLKSETRKYA